MKNAAQSPSAERAHTEALPPDDPTIVRASVSAQNALGGISYCHRCGMGFHVELPHPKAQSSLCAEPECDRFFWHYTEHARGVAVVGVWPENH